MKRLLLLALIILSFPNTYSQERKTLTKENLFGKFTFSYIEVDGKVVYDGPCSYTEKFNFEAPDGTPSTHSQIVKGAYKNGNPDGQWVWTLNGKNRSTGLDDTYYYNYTIKMIRTLKNGVYDGLYSFESNIHERAGWYVGTTWRWVFDRKHNPYKESFIIKDGKVTGTSEGYTCKDNVVTKYLDKEYTNGFLNNTVVDNHVVRFTDEEIDSLMTFFAENPNTDEYLYRTDSMCYYFKRNRDSDRFRLYSEYIETNQYSPMSSFWVNLEDEGFGLPNFDVELQTIECTDVKDYIKPELSSIPSKLARLEHSSYPSSCPSPNLRETLIREYSFEPYLKEDLDSVYAIINRYVDFREEQHMLYNRLDTLINIVQKSTPSCWRDDKMGALDVLLDDTRALWLVDSYRATIFIDEIPLFHNTYDPLLRDRVLKGMRTLKHESIIPKDSVLFYINQYETAIPINDKRRSDYNENVKKFNSSIEEYSKVISKIVYYRHKHLFSESLNEIESRFDYTKYDNTVLAKIAYYTKYVDLIRWYEVNYKKARKMKTVDELFAAAGITF